MSEERKKSCVVEVVTPVKYDAMTGTFSGSFSLEAEVNRKDAPAWSITPGRTTITFDKVSFADYVKWSIARSIWVPVQNRLRAMKYSDATASLKAGVNVSDVLNPRREARKKTASEMLSEISGKLADASLTVEERKELLKQIEALADELQASLVNKGD